jgi:predicted O-methyltransferase YrrM
VYATEVEVGHLLAGLVRAVQPEQVFESGTYLGHTALLLARALAENGHGHLYTVENQPERAQAAQHLLRRHKKFATALCGDSLQLLHDLPGSFQLAWLDSAYACRSMELQLLHSTGKLSPGAIVVVHDTALHHPYDVAGELRSLDWMVWMWLATPRGVAVGQYAPTAS